MHASAVHRQEPGTDRRSRHQYRRKPVLCGEGRVAAGCASEGRYVRLCGNTATEGRSDRPDGVSSLLKPLVLVVEDEAALATMLRYNLEKQGYRVEEAADGQEGATRTGATPHG